MRHTAQSLDKVLTAQKDSISSWLFLAGLFLFVFLLWGKPVPFSNEFPYLLRLVKEAQPEFLLNDWTFSVPANEHWLFNRLFGFLATLMPVEILGWLGRIVVWAFTWLLFAVAVLIVWAVAFAATVYILKFTMASPVWLWAAGAATVAAVAFTLAAKKFLWK
jgi:hypothetical protein